jgi:hypothetical protein
MIEVEGKIYNQPITILIDYVARHISYIDPCLLEIFHLKRRKYGKY